MVAEGRARRSSKGDSGAGVEGKRRKERRKEEEKRGEERNEIDEFLGVDEGKFSNPVSAENKEKEKGGQASDKKYLSWKF